MKPIGVLSTAVLFWLLGGSASMLAQQEQEEARPARQEEARPPQEARPEEGRPQQEARPPQHEEARPPEHPEETRPPQHEPEARPPQHPEEARPPLHGEEARPVPAPPERAQPGHDQAVHPQQGPAPEQRRAMQTAWEGHRAQHWQSEHRDWRARGGYHGYRIPQERYAAYFGPSHAFAIYSVPVVVGGGFPRFQYQGFWFTVVDPWPEYWASDWFYTDTVYVAYISDGYYLCDQRYPGVQLAISVSV